MDEGLACYYAGVDSPWVLLAEDDDGDALLAQRAFRRYAGTHRLVRARDGQEALDALKTAPQLPCLVILDLKMPRLGGLDVLRALPPRGERGFPIAILSSSGEPRDLECAEALGCDHYAVKPVEFESYLRVAEGLVGRFLT